MYRIDTIQQVLSELLFLYHLLQVPVRGADQADIDGDRGPERAKAVKEKIEKIAKFKKIIIINTAGVSSMYANDGGVIMAV